MKRISLIAAFAAAAAACSGGSEKPGALLRGPGALAVFDGIVAHGTGTIRPYLAVANERGDELRLVDTTDNEIVESPGLVFPLSVPFTGRPMLLASADLNEVEYRPSALLVIAAGSNVVELIDTWSGYPTVAARVQLEPEAEVLAMTAEPLPAGAGGRVVVALSGGRLEIIELARGAGDSIVPTLRRPALPPLTFDAASLAPSRTPGVVYAASRDLLPGALFGVARIALPQDLTGWDPAAAGTVKALDALAPTEAVAVATFDDWIFPTPGSPPAQADTWGGSVERVIAVPVASACGEGKKVACGLLALDPGAAWGGALLGHLVPNSVAGESPYRPPIPIPAPVAGILATGRTSAELLTMTSGAGTQGTTGLAVVTATNGGIYLVDLARWAMASETSPLVGDRRARVAAAAPVPGASSAIGLWGLDGSAPSALDAELSARVRVTPGFTPDETWRLTWQGVLPGLEARGATFEVSGGTRTLAVQLGTAPGADLAKLGVADGDSVELRAIGAIAAYCPAGAEVAVSGAPAGSVVTLTVPAGSCLEAVPDPSSTSVVATVRASGLVLTGATAGYAGRPVAAAAFGAEFQHAGRRLFYVTDACVAGSACASIWQVPPYDLTLKFPLPTGPAVGLLPAWLDADGKIVDVAPSRGTAIQFTTASGLTPSGRRPIVDGAAVASSLPSGLVLLDPGGAGTGVRVLASYTAGLIMDFWTSNGTGTMAVIR